METPESSAKIRLLRKKARSRGTFIAGGQQLIAYVMDDHRSKTSFQLVNEKKPCTPQDFFPVTYTSVKQKYPEPFEKYSTHLPRRTILSILLDIMQSRLYTDSNVLQELSRLFAMPVCPQELNQNSKNFNALEPSVICVCFNSRNSPINYFGASLSCWQTSKIVMINVSCLHEWHDYVSHVVMSARSVKDPLDSLKFPETLRCQAYRRNLETNVYEKISPCMNCKLLFNLPGEKKKPDFYPYGNCAETECLSKLLKNDKDMANDTKIIKNTKYNIAELQELTMQELRKNLVSLSCFQNRNNEDILLFNPNESHNRDL